MKNACPFPAWCGINQFKTIFGGAPVCRSSSEPSRSPGDRPKNTTPQSISKQACCHHCISPEASFPCKGNVSPSSSKTQNTKICYRYPSSPSPSLSPPFLFPRALTEASETWYCCLRSLGNREPNVILASKALESGEATTSPNNHCGGKREERSAS